MKKDLLIISIFPLIIFLLVFLFDLDITYLESLILVFAVPCAYLSFCSREKVRKVALFSLLVSIPIALIVELIAFWDHAWVIPQSQFAFRLFGFSPIENYIWQFLTVYTILIFYEHFCKKKFSQDISKRTRWMNLGLYSLALFVSILFINDSFLLHISYPYLWFCIPFFIIPIVVFLAKYPSYFMAFLKVQLFFLYIHTIFELIGVKLSHWIYPSNHFIGWVTILGQRFPTEEFVFVMLIGAFAACTYYEFFTNKELKS
mgnify:CR=1 FL=1